jgi:hypothetical protein
MKGGLFFSLAHPAYTAILYTKMLQAIFRLTSKLVMDYSIIFVLKLKIETKTMNRLWHRHLIDLLKNKAD